MFTPNLTQNQEYRLDYTFNYDSIQLGYKNYVKWERNNSFKERKLPGFTLNNQQMYWLTFANSYFMKNNINHRSYQFDALKIQYKFFHIWFKAREEFREAFKCDGMTEKEIKEFELLKQIFERIRRF